MLELFRILMIVLPGILAAVVLAFTIDLVRKHVEIGLGIGILGALLLAVIWAFAQQTEGSPEIVLIGMVCGLSMFFFLPDVSTSSSTSQIITQVDGKTIVQTSAAATITFQKDGDGYRLTVEGPRGNKQSIRLS